LLKEILGSNTLDRNEQKALLSEIIKSGTEYNQNEIKILQEMKEVNDEQWNKEKESLGEIKWSIKNVQIYCQKEVHDNLVIIKKFLESYHEEEIRKLEAIPKKLLPALEAIKENASTNTQLLEMLGENQRLAFNKIEKNMNIKWDNSQNSVGKLYEEHLNRIENIYQLTNAHLESNANTITELGKETRNLKPLIDLYENAILKGINELPKSISELLTENIITLLNQKESDKLKFQN
jgi:hypothetical protein